MAQAWHKGIGPTMICQLWVNGKCLLGYDVCSLLIVPAESSK